jgi:hypothetical protein
MIVAATLADEYLHRSDYRNTLQHGHRTLLTLPTVDIDLDSFMLAAPATRDFVGLLLLYVCGSGQSWSGGQV